ncbi:MAG TPA: DUF4118 domain-containing protein [Frateuria sp.]|uniref:DUF4118 domain-containing protein n=1 Tax=Frateuria sp. TaxID=2211372 RepID=UPI002DE24918|nr:DUF4118 domain-containing protein [Frateuria sp.]
MDHSIISLVREKRYPMIVRYGAGLLFVAVAFAIVLTWQGQLQRYPFPIFIPAIFFAALLFERGSGVLATFAAAALATYFFLRPVHSFAMAETDTVSVAAFLLVGIVISTVTDRMRRTVEGLRRSEAEKTLMLEEAGHRVRNDLMMVTSVLSLQARGQTDPAVRAALESAVARVAVIANAQDRIRASGDGQGKVDLSRLAPRGDGRGTNHFAAPKRFYQASRWPILSSLGMRVHRRVHANRGACSAGVSRNDIWAIQPDKQGVRAFLLSAWQGHLSSCAAAAQRITIRSRAA